LMAWTALATGCRGRVSATTTPREYPCH